MIPQFFSYKNKESIKYGRHQSIHIALWYLSMQYTTIINSILLNNGCTVIVAVIAWFFFKEKMTGQTVIGIVLAVLGSMFLVGESFEIGNQALHLNVSLSLEKYFQYQ